MLEFVYHNPEFGEDFLSSDPYLVCITGRESLITDLSKIDNFLAVCAGVTDDYNLCYHVQSPGVFWCTTS